MLGQETGHDAGFARRIAPQQVFGTTPFRQPHGTAALSESVDPDGRSPGIHVSGTRNGGDAVRHRGSRLFAVIRTPDPKHIPASVGQHRANTLLSPPAAGEIGPKNDPPMRRHASVHLGFQPSGERFDLHVGSGKEVDSHRIRRRAHETGKLRRIGPDTPPGAVGPQHGGMLVPRHLPESRSRENGQAARRHGHHLPPFAAGGLAVVTVGQQADRVVCLPGGRGILSGSDKPFGGIPPRMLGVKPFLVHQRSPLHGIPHQLEPGVAAVGGKYRFQPPDLML